MNAKPAVISARQIRIAHVAAFVAITKRKRLHQHGIKNAMFGICWWWEGMILAIVYKKSIWLRLKECNIT